MSGDPMIGGVRVDVVEAGRRMRAAGVDLEQSVSGRCGECGHDLDAQDTPCAQEAAAPVDGCDLVSALEAVLESASDACFVAGAPETVNPSMAMVVPVPKGEGAAKVVAVITHRLTGGPWDVRLYESATEYLIAVHLRAISSVVGA